MRLIFLTSILFLFNIVVFAQGNNDIYDITYKIATNNDSVKLDLFQPTKKLYEKNPVVVFIHGGAWAKGDKHIEHLYYMRSLRDTLRSKGYAVATINYRLVTKTINIADQVTDCRDALQWIKNNATTYNLDTDNIGLCGESAGAHLALLLTYTNKNKTIEDDAIKIKYVVDNFGPTDLNKVLKTKASFVTKALYKLVLPELYDVRKKLIHAITTYPIDSNKEQAIAVAKEYSPIHNLLPNQKTPLLILHGTRDFVVPIKQSKKLKKVFEANNIETSFVKVKKGNHGFKNIDSTKIQELISKTTLFIQKNT
ncbi:alpha/beta hydrolase [Flavobacterium sp. xlx-214]|uniref:alpha/beta hydrolase n=1 Tax=unclassified Flavobacterium TaxID=196869 RepID=UPI0013D7ECED|nr:MULTISPECIES: alpha/beta hydrolase [unclassified Flavobacterium]MBA5793229.1 alpha/beta hydrolase [Flavobacterium sp. xlx-221]QMI82488.1 alpha/beta hydrolase [Flavobacterium sp. xlx-214]